MKRDRNIDNLRGLAILIMILTHTTAWYRAARSADFIWDFSHFVVPVFLFCSFFLFFNKPVELNWSNFFPYFKKRLLRLLVPYYIYLSIYSLMQFFLEGKKISVDYLIRSAFFFGGPDSSWLVTLFVYLTIISPLIWHWYRKTKFWFYLYGATALGSTVYFLFNGYPNYRQIMWLPWTVIIYFTLYFVTYIGKKVNRIMILSLISFLLFFLLRFYLFSQHKTLVLFNNKYPPNLYYLSYGIFFVLFLYVLSSRGFFAVLKSEKMLSFFSRYSYSIYFIQNLVIYGLDKLNIRFGFWPVFFLAITGLTVIIQMGLTRMTNMINNKEIRK